MEQVFRNKPFIFYLPYTFLATALFSFYIIALNKVELRPFEMEYPEESFIAPSFELPTLSGGNINLIDYTTFVFTGFDNTYNIKHLDATDGLAAATCHHFQNNITSSNKNYSDWKSFVKNNPNKIA